MGRVVARTAVPEIRGMRYGFGGPLVAAPATFRDRVSKIYGRAPRHIAYFSFHLPPSVPKWRELVG